MAKCNTFKGFTLIETIIVVIIVSILLTMVILVGSTYLRNVEYRYEKQQFIGIMDRLITMSRTSNFRGGQTYELLEIELSPDEVVATVYESLTSQAGVTIDTFALEQSRLVLTTGFDTISLFPYNILCAAGTGYTQTGGVIYLDEGEGHSMTFPFSQVSLFTEQETCYEIDLRLCKLQQVACDE